MLVQILQAKVHDPELFGQQATAWETELRPNAAGWLGATWGVTADNDAFLIARFESAEAAHSNPDVAAQTAWYEKTTQAFDGEPTFRDSEDVDLLLGGGSDDAGFVQVMEGRVKDREAFRAAMPALEADLRSIRPDLLGAVVIWHETRDFTQVSYFTSEKEARLHERPMTDHETETYQRFTAMLDGPTTFYDLTSPGLH